MAGFSPRARASRKRSRPLSSGQLPRCGFSENGIAAATAMDTYPLELEDGISAGSWPACASTFAGGATDLGRVPHPLNGCRPELLVFRCPHAETCENPGTGPR